MRIEIDESNRFGRLTATRLAEFERRLGTTLPESYRTHLLEHNGGFVDGAHEISEVHHVHGLHDGPEWARFPDTQSAYGGLIPKTLLPIADDPGGNFFCIVLSGPRRGSVCFWYHERAADPAGNVTELAPDFVTYQRGVAIKVAIARNQLEMVREAVAEVGMDGVVYAGKTILDLALEQGSDALVELLVKSGARIRDDALLEAVRNASIATARLLLARGVDVNHVIPSTGFTALMLAASRDVPEIAELLLRHGADPHKRNKWGKSAGDLAHTSRMRDLLGGKSSE